MNIFKTLPRFADFLITTGAFNKNGPELDRLRAEGDLEGERALVLRSERAWMNDLTKRLRISFDVEGEENIPSPGDGAFMVYSNHQGFADIAAVMWLFTNHGLQIGFVAKEEWRKHKVLATAIGYTRSVFLERGDHRKALKTIGEAKELLDNGFNLSIFPEGTRSHSHEMHEFKAGAFKFAEKAGVPVLPVTLDGGYKMFEEKNSFQASRIKITVHPMVHIEQMDRSAQRQAAKDIEATIRGALN